MVPFESLVRFPVRCILFQRYSETLVENRNFSYPVAFDVPFRGPRRNIIIPFGVKKTRMVWLTDGENKFEDMFNRLDRIRACDGQTNRHLATA